MAYDLGQPVPYETTQPLQVALTDIDDNEPIFLKPPVGVGNVTLRKLAEQEIPRHFHVILLEEFCASILLLEV